MSRDTETMFASAGLILFNATSSYELIAPGKKLATVRSRYNLLGTWRMALRDAFGDAFKIDYEAVFLYAVRVLDVLPPGPATEAALQELVQTSEYVTSHAGLLNLDLAGRIYHSALGQSLAKSFATYYTSIPAGELLAWLTVERWDDKVCDFACGSGTLLLSAYHRKLGLSFLQGWNGSIGDLHKRFVEEEIWGFDAMPFAAHLTLVNLLLQQPNEVFDDSRVFKVPVGAGKRLGSLDLLKKDKIVVQRRMTGKDIGATQQAVSLKFKQTEIQVMRNFFDVVIMNPPFTKKQRVTQVLDKKELTDVLNRLRRGLTAAGGLPIPFVALGDLHVKEGGRLALVLPSAVLGRDTWQSVRNILLESYDIEHLMISWVPGRPAFSESTDLREVLVVARKRPSALLSQEHSKDKDGRTLVSHFDLLMNFTESRQIAEQLTSLTKGDNVPDTDLLSTQTLRLGAKAIGESVSFPKSLIQRTVPNWYRLLSFRQVRLVKQALLQSRLLPDLEPEFDFDFSNLLAPLSTMADVGLFVKSVGRAGYAVVDQQPSQGGVPVLMTSKFHRMQMGKDEARWLIRDFTIHAVETFTPGQGILLIPRKANLFSTLCVSAIVCDIPSSGSMWIPVAPRSSQKTKDGYTLTSKAVARLLALWSQSSFGFLSLMFERQEIEGAWSEWLTEAVRERLVLNPRKLRKKQVTSLLEAFSKVKDVRWDTIIGQFSGSAPSSKYREEIDDCIVETLLKKKTRKLPEFRQQIAHEIELLGQLMKSSKQSAPDRKTVQTTL